jgi:GAF domain-containing protein
LNRTIRILLADYDAEFRQKLASALFEEGIEADMAAGRMDLFEQLQSLEGRHTLAVIGQLEKPEEQIQVVAAVRRQYPSLDVVTLTEPEHAWRTNWNADRLVCCTADREANGKILAHTIRSTVWQRSEHLRSQTMQSLLSASEPFGTVTGQDQLYQQLYEEATALLPGLDAFVVAHNDEQSNKISFPFAYKHDKRIHIPSRLQGNGLAEYVLLTRNALLLPYGDERIRMQLGLSAPDLNLGLSQSEIVVPMFLEEGKVYGVLFASTENPNIHYSAAHKQILSTLASKAAFTLRQLNEKKDASELRDAIAAVAKQHGREAVLRAIVERAHKLVNSSFTGLILMDEDGSLHKVGPVLPEEFHEKFAEARQEGGLTRAVITSRRPIKIPDTSQNILVKDSVLEAGIKSMLVLPLIHDEHVLGALYMHTFVYRGFATRDVELWSAFATQAASALDRVIEEERQSDYKRLIHELDSLDEPIGLRETLVRVATVAKLIFRSDTCRLFFIDSATRNVVRSDWAEDDALEYHLENDPRPHGSTHYVLESRQPFYYPDMKEGPSQRPDLLAAGLKSSVSLPLRYGARDIGVLHCNYFTRKMIFNEHFKTQLEAFGARAAVAIHRAAREHKAEIWHGLDREIVNCTEVRQLYQLFTDKAHEALQADFSLFYPYDPSSNDSARFPLKDEVVMTGTWRTPWKAPRGGRGGGVIRELTRRHAPLIVNDLDPKKYFSRIANREGVRAFVAVRLEVLMPDTRKPRLVGILFVNYRQPTQFTEPDLAELIAASELIAAGILRLRLQNELERAYQELGHAYHELGHAYQQRNRQLRAVIEIFRVHEASTADLNLDHIAEQAARALGLDTCSILEFNTDTRRYTDRGNFGLRNNQHVNGVLRPAFEQKYMHQEGLTVIADLRKDPLMRASIFVRDEGLRSVMVYPLRAEGKTLGLMFGNYRELTHPSPEEQDAFILFANVAAHVLQRSIFEADYNERQMRDERRKLLVWVSMFEDMWQHTLVQKASSIRILSGTLRGQLRRHPRVPLDIDALHATIEEMDRLALDIASAPPRVPRESEMLQELIPIGSLLQGFAARELRSNHLRNDHRHSIEVNVSKLGGAQVYGYRRWLIYTLESIFQNSYKAMPKQGTITVVGTKQRQWVEIRIQDTGKGVPRRLQDIIFKQAVTGKRTHSGLGIGSVLATTLMEETGGSIALEKPGPADTTVLLRLPVAKQAKRR